MRRLFKISSILLFVGIVGWMLVPIPGPYNRGENGLWMGIEWFQGDPSPTQRSALRSHISDGQIRYLFVYTTWMTADGTPRHAIPKDAHDKIQQLRSIAPQSLLLAWIGIPLTTLGRGPVDLDNQEIRTRIALFSRQLVQEVGFDGIHLDAEPVPDGSLSFLRLLDDVRDAVGKEAFLSIAGEDAFPRLAGRRLPYLHQIKWSADYYKEVAQRVDQIVVMTYDSAMPLGILYELWLGWQVPEITRSLGHSETELLFGIATYEETTWTHMPWAENVKTGLRGIRRGVGRLPPALQKKVNGVALYAEWAMEPSEWEVYQQLWIGKESAEETEDKPTGTTWTGVATSPGYQAPSAESIQ
nr:glycosyl hydrolase family 18 protein [Ardenticatena sp.]